MAEERGGNINPRLLIILALAFPPAAVFFDIIKCDNAIAPLFYLISGGFGYYMLNDKFIEKVKVRKVKPVHVGPEEPLIHPGHEKWVSRKDEEGELHLSKEYVPPRSRRY